jgi:hypothetical protein
MRTRPRPTRRRRLAWAAVAALLAPGSGAAAEAPDAAPAELLSRTWDNLYGVDSAQVLRLTSKSPQGRAVTRKLWIVRKYSAPPPRALIRFLEPSDVRGTSMLVIERETRDSDVFLYLPAFQRTKRITAAQRFDAFFGTNLTYEDLEPKRPQDFEVRALGTDGAGELRCERLDVRPRPGVESQYEHTVFCIEPQRAVILWADYTVKGSTAKRLETDPWSIRRVGDRHLPFRARLRTHATGFETEIAVEEHEARPELPDSVFTIPHLELGDETSPGAATVVP